MHKLLDLFQVFNKYLGLHNTIIDGSLTERFIQLEVTSAWLGNGLRPNDCQQKQLEESLFFKYSLHGPSSILLRDDDSGIGQHGKLPQDDVDAELLQMQRWAFNESWNDYW